MKVACLVIPTVQGDFVVEGGYESDSEIHDVRRQVGPDDPLYAECQRVVGTSEPFIELEIEERKS